MALIHCHKCRWWKAGKDGEFLCVAQRWRFHQFRKVVADVLGPEFGALVAPRLTRFDIVGRHRRWLGVYLILVNSIVVGVVAVAPVAVDVVLRIVLICDMCGVVVDGRMRCSERGRFEAVCVGGLTSTAGRCFEASCHGHCDYNDGPRQRVRVCWKKTEFSE